ncbi:methyltransferase domain protein [Ceratobasidium sp. AG-Ba]|nr:methyltransferase domain protein [Ceratobasidium sp. AG-Ba]
MSAPDPVHSPENLPVRFIPPLADERQRWIMETLRLNDVRSVLDIGCGEGSLLHAVCGPASSIPSDVPDSHLSTPINDLFLQRVAALDVDPAVIEDAVYAATSDRKPHYLAPWGSGEDGWYIRWSPLEVSVWEGSLAVINPEFSGFDAIVSTEVIEHVPESILPAFSHVLLGQYRPRLLILTTPNYTFNARFHPPGVARKGFLDPTGETDRVFRHSDHKREWTVPEFTEWCHEAANRFEYDVTLDGVGVPTEPDPFGRELGYASQTAVFVRRDRGVDALPLANLSLSETWSPSPDPPHKLVAQRKFDVDPRAGHPESSRTIRDALVYLMQMRGEGELTFGELWSELAMPCGGSVAALVNALMEKGGSDDVYASQESDLEDTIGQWSILPPRNPNNYTQPRWDRVVVWSGFQPELFGNEERSSEDEHLGTGGDIEVEYASDEGSANDTRDDDKPALANGGGWGGTGWGEWDTDQAGAWGESEDSRSDHLVWSSAEKQT